MSTEFAFVMQYINHESRFVMESAKKYKYMGFILLQSVIYGFGNPLTKIAFESITPFWSLAIRFTTAFLVFMLFFGKRIIESLKSVEPKVYLPASICMAAAYITCNLALNWTSATNVGFLMSLPVIFAPVLALFLYKVKYRLIHIPIQIVVVIGLYLLCFDGEKLVFGKGEVTALITALSIAGALVFGEESLKQLDAVAVSAAQAGITALISLPCALIFESIEVLSRVTLPAWLVVLYLAIFCTNIAYMLQNTALKHISAAAVSMLQCTQPILTAIISYFILREKLSTLGVIGAVIIIMCIIAENIITAKEQAPSENLVLK
ncbi:MAG: DMT family transporter [Sedimentibacter sp.]|jgi:drug/metabolite transporter (DMT)-like permease|nr:DMT family transporter [Sedimentibacter sp.]